MIPNARTLGRGDVSLACASGLYGAAAALGLSVLADSGVEHYRGGYRNRAMYAPLLSSGALLAVALTGVRRPQGLSRGGLVFALAMGVGAAGLAFHVYDVGKRPGRFNWLNLFYAAPLGAPAALSLAGLLGLAAQALARGRRKLLGLAAGRTVAALSAVGLAGAAAEAALLHFRGAFQNPFMWIPVTLGPLAAGTAARVAFESHVPDDRRVSRAVFSATALAGLAGTAFHAFGVSRAMGGWRNWRQNLIDGPPLPAPPAFTALSFSALVALRLRDSEERSAP